MDHKPLENYLGRYGGLMLYLKEMDESVYGKLCAVCSSVFDLGRARSLSLGVLLCRKQPSHDPDQGFPVYMQYYG